MHKDTPDSDLANLPLSALLDLPPTWTVVDETFYQGEEALHVVPDAAAGAEAIVVYREHGRAPVYAAHDRDGEVVGEVTSWAEATVVLFERARESGSGRTA